MNHTQTHEMPQKPMEMHDMHDKKNYRNLAIMAVLSFISMYILMYAMVDALGNVFNNVNQFYMAGLMTAPMIILELLLMKMMYKDKRLNAIIISAALIVGLAFFLFIRQQSAVTDKQFLRSMIPHHGGAILMCEQASLTDQEIKDLCVEIVEAQVSEIDHMKSILDRLER